MKGPTLYRLSVERKFDRIPDHVKQNPEDVYWTDQHGSTALHILCQARDVDHPLLIAIEVIVKEAPELIAQPNHSTWTPLHYAAEKRLVWGGGGGGSNHCGATKLVLMLLKYCPHAVSIRTQTGLKSGKTPFHIACEANADSRVLRAMLRINPGLSTEPYVKKDVYSVAENPLQLLWANNSNNDNNNSNNFRSERRRSSLTSTSEKMALLLRAAHYGTVEDDFHQQGSSRIQLVAAACSVRCPQDYFIELINQHPEQVRELDDFNLLPLHYAIRNASVDAQTYTKFILELLLERNPDAASKVDDADGRLPLHIALMDSKLTWHKGGIRELVYAYPTALRTRDPLYQLLPFMASAYHSIKSMLHLSTTYELLLAAPDVIEIHTWCS